MEHDSIDIDQKYINLIELDPLEKLICIIRRHVVGLIGVFITGIFITLMVLLGSIFLGTWLSEQPELGDTGIIGTIISIAGIILSGLVLFFTYVAGYVFSNSVILVTSDKIAQVLYKNLIDRKISQLSLGDIQDVTVDQKGILARIFKYGTLTIETAGEQNNFIFTFTPHPYQCAKDIVGAREASIKKYGN